MLICVISLLPQMRFHCELRSCDADLHVLLRMWPLLQPGGVVPDSDCMKFTKNLLLDLANPDGSPANRALQDLAALLDSRTAIPALHEFNIDGGMDAMTIPMVWCSEYMERYTTHVRVPILTVKYCSPVSRVQTKLWTLWCVVHVVAHPGLSRKRPRLGWCTPVHHRHDLIWGCNL